MYTIAILFHPAVFAGLPMFHCRCLLHPAFRQYFYDSGLRPAAPVFSTGKFSPVLGAAVQEVVDVVVIFNALRAHVAGHRVG